MPITWISISTRWGITSVQATLNVLLSVLGTIGIWTFSRYWWQRGILYVLRGEADVPLCALLSLTGPGEGYDTVRVLRRRVFAKENRRLLLQLFIVLVATLACMFAGPIAKISLRSTQTAQAQKVEVLQTTKGNGFIGNRLDANVEWNDTMQSLDNAKFPYNQLLDYLPPVSEPWIYVAREWDPTWSVACDYHEEAWLHNLAGTGNATFNRPLEAFPAYRDTYDPLWLDTTKYRIQADSNFEQVYTEDHGVIIKDALFWVLIQSEPRVDNRMYTNDAPLRLSISSLHAQNFGLSPNDTDATGASLDQWRPFGPVENASYSRLECNITRNVGVLEETNVPWVWTNDTWSITFAYRTYWMTEVGQRSSKNLTVTPPTPQTLFRFYQAYMVSVNTWMSQPSTRKISVWTETVQMSTAILVVLILLTLLELWISGRYFWFLRRYNQELEKLCVPDGRIDWMIHAAKLAAQGTEKETDVTKREEHKGQLPLKDRDYFGQASFGSSADSGIAPPQLARVYTSSRTSFACASPSSDRRPRSKSRIARSKSLSSKTVPRIFVRSGKEAQRSVEKDGPNWHALERFPSSVGSGSIRDVDLTVSSNHEATQSCSGEHNPHLYENRLSPMISRTSSEGRSRAFSGGASCSRSSFRSIVPEEDEIEPVSSTGDIDISHKG